MQYQGEGKLSEGVYLVIIQKRHIKEGDIFHVGVRRPVGDDHSRDFFKMFDVK